MMGVAQFDLTAPIFKGTNAILAFCGDEAKGSKTPSCIRCGRCVEACPMRLMPTYIYLYGEKDVYKRQLLPFPPDKAEKVVVNGPLVPIFLLPAFDGGQIADGLLQGHNCLLYTSRCV